MKNTVRSACKIFVALLLFSLMTLQISHSTSPIPIYRPIYLSFEALRAPIKSQAPELLRNPGKILVKGDLIFISEQLKGVHVIDNSDPTAPKHIAFIKVPGNIDLAMKDNILYADSYVDLIALDVSNPREVFVTKRLENIYPNEAFIEEETFWNEEIDHEKGVVVDREFLNFEDSGNPSSDGQPGRGLGCSR